MHRFYWSIKSKWNECYWTLFNKGCFDNIIGHLAIGQLAIRYSLQWIAWVATKQYNVAFQSAIGQCPKQPSLNQVYIYITKESDGLQNHSALLTIHKPDRMVNFTPRMFKNPGSLYVKTRNWVLSALYLRMTGSISPETLIQKLPSAHGHILKVAPLLRRQLQ